MELISHFHKHGQMIISGLEKASITYIRKFHIHHMFALLTLCVKKKIENEYYKTSFHQLK